LKVVAKNLNYYFSREILTYHNWMWELAMHKSDGMKASEVCEMMATKRQTIIMATFIFLILQVQCTEID
jgi:hypothetical protein